MNYLPVKRGQTLQPSKPAPFALTLSNRILIKSVYRARQYTVIHVVNVPRLVVKIAGNSIIPTDKLTTVMKTLMSQKDVYNPVVLERIRQVY